MANVLTPERVRRWSLALIVAYAAIVVMIVAPADGFIDPRNDTPLGADFMAFWSASRVASSTSAAI